MKLYRRSTVLLIVIMLVIAACGSDGESATQPTATQTLAGAVLSLRSSPTPTLTPTDLPTNTPTVTPSATNTPVDTPTDIPTETLTNTPTSTLTDTPTDLPTLTPTNIPADTPVATATDVPTNTPTITNVPTETALLPSGDRIDINFGEAVVGLIQGESISVEYGFEAESGDVIDLVMVRNSGTLDSVLYLFNANNELIAEGVSEDTGSAIRNFTVPEDGTYTVIVSRVEEGAVSTTGTFELIVSPQTTIIVDGAFTPPLPNETIQIGQAVTGTITDETPMLYYIFNADANQSVTILMDTPASELDPLVVLIDPEGREIARNDDGQESLDSEIDNVILPFTGQYMIIASRYRQEFGLSITGDFRLSLFESQGSSEVAIIPTPLDFNDFADGFISDSFAVDTYTMFGERGDSISLIVDSLSDDLDALVILMSNTGQEIIRSDYTLTTNLSDATIERFILPYTGYYTIVVGSDGDGFGDYEVRIRLDEAANDTVEIPLYAQSIPPFTHSLTNDSANTIISLINVGDWVLNDTSGEYVTEAYLTYRLPELSSDTIAERVILTLDICESFTDGQFGDASIMDEFGGILSVFLNNQFTSLGDINTIANTNASVVADIVACERLDVTEAIRNAYAGGFTFVQFRLTFDAPAILNNEIDILIFEEPRLEIYMGD